MNKAVIVIDVQEAFFILPEINLYQKESLILNINQLIDNARNAGLPVIFVQHTELSDPADEFYKDSPGWPLHPGLHRLESDPVIRKSVPNSFHETSLASLLDKLGAKQLIFAGAQTDYCINATIRAAHDLGYKDNLLLRNGHSTLDSQSQTAREIIEQHEREWLNGGYVTIADLNEMDL